MSLRIVDKIASRQADGGRATASPDWSVAFAIRGCVTVATSKSLHSMGLLARSACSASARTSLISDSYAIAIPVRSPRTSMTLCAPEMCVFMHCVQVRMSRVVVRADW